MNYAVVPAEGGRALIQLLGDVGSCCTSRIFPAWPPVLDTTGSAHSCTISIAAGKMSFKVDFIYASSVPGLQVGGSQRCQQDRICWGLGPEFFPSGRARESPHPPPRSALLSFSCFPAHHPVWMPQTQGRMRSESTRLNSSHKHRSRMPSSA